LFNGKSAIRFEDSSHLRGHIGVFLGSRVSKTSEIHIRKVEIKKLPPEEPGFQPLFNGKDLAGWQKPEDGWTVERGDLVCRKGASAAMFYEAKEFADFRLRVEVESVADTNLGVGFRAAPTDKKFAPKGYEIPIGTTGRPGNIIKVAAKPPVLALAPLLDKKQLPAVHLWEVIAIGSHIQVKRDGVLVNEVRDDSHRRGQIYLIPRTGNGEARFRKIESRNCRPTNAAPW
jgi:hypothetical protein